VSLLGTLIFKPCHFAAHYSLIVKSESSMKIELTFRSVARIVLLKWS